MAAAVSAALPLTVIQNWGRIMSLKLIVWEYIQGFKHTGFGTIHLALCVDSVLPVARRHRLCQCHQSTDAIPNLCMGVSDVRLAMKFWMASRKVRKSMLMQFCQYTLILQHIPCRAGLFWNKILKTVKFFTFPNFIIVGFIRLCTSVFPSLLLRRFHAVNLKAVSDHLHDLIYWFPIQSRRTPIRNKELPVGEQWKESSEAHQACSPWVHVWADNQAHNQADHLGDHLVASQAKKCTKVGMEKEQKNNTG